MPTEDGILIARVVAENDHRAFAQLVNRHQSKLRYSLRQLTGWDEALADDLAQETFIKAYNALGSFRGDANFGTWLYRIAYNCFAAHMRTQKPMQQLNEKLLEDQSYDAGTAQALHRDFAAALQQLSEDQRVALHLYLQRELTHQEIADVMNCPLGTVKSHIQRGRKKLKSLLASWQPAEALQ